MEDLNVESLGWGFVDAAARGTDHVAFAVWRCPTREHRGAIQQAGWYEYFDQIDFGGEAGAADAVLQHHIELAGSAP